MTRILSLGLAASLLSAGVAFAAPGKGSTPPAPPAPPVPAPAPAAATPAADEAVFKSQETADDKLTADELTFDTLEDVPLPENKIGSKKGDTQADSLTAKRLRSIPVGQSWLEPVVIADTIGNDDERKKAFGEEVKTIQNRINGAIRRFRKADVANAKHSFTVAKVMDDKRGYGVRVYRNEDKAPKVETPATA